jgi:hypothetical protein
VLERYRKAGHVTLVVVGDENNVVYAPGGRKFAHFGWLGCASRRGVNPEHTRLGFGVATGIMRWAIYYHCDEGVIKSGLKT